MRETWVQSLGWEDPLEEGVATYSSILARRIPWTEETGGLQFMGSQRVGHNWVTNTFTVSQSLLRFMSNELMMLSNQSHPLLTPSPPAFSLSQHQGLFQWVSSSDQVAGVLELQHQNQPFQWISRGWFSLALIHLILIQSFIHPIKHYSLHTYCVPDTRFRLQDVEMTKKWIL